MIDWLTAVWTKLNRPLSFFLGGAAIIIFAPSEVAWTGYVSIAVGLAGAIEWAGARASKWHDSRKPAKHFQKMLPTFNDQEKLAFREQLKKGEQTFYLDWNDYHGRNARLGVEREYRRLSGVYLGLVHKGFLTARSDHTITTFHIVDTAWTVLREAHKRNPNFLNGDAAS